MVDRKIKQSSALTAPTEASEVKSAVEPGAVATPQAESMAVVATMNKTIKLLRKCI